MGDTVGFIAAFGAGAISFLSPCVLPLVPGYLSFVTGITPVQLERGTRVRDVLLPSLLFVLGFSIVFVAFGASASALGAALAQFRPVLVRVAGVVVFLLGFFLLGLVRIPWLYGEARFDMGGAKKLGRWSAPVVGMAFAFGWTPCVGPILGAILGLAGSTGDVRKGIALLAAYSAGLGVPFVLTALVFGRARTALRWASERSEVLNRIAGLVLMAMGVLIATDRMSVIARWLVRTFPFLQLG